ncbi:MAG: rRNA maturation RNase YbeY [Candidatus Delongbacteria bacterium]|jgi:probable rRNA maturation factor|nr:rRNA maturation RNase YbeY [Candidatus Delongbacteria bacterium]
MKTANISIDNITKSRICRKKTKKLIMLFEDMHKCNVDTLSISFINDEEMIDLNKEHLKHEGSTDIITFTYEKDLNNLDGEILICVDEAKRQARQYKVKLINELNRLVFHGLLHLIGYKDQTKKEKEIMHKCENELLKYLEENNIKS